MTARALCLIQPLTKRAGILSLNLADRNHLHAPQFKIMKELVLIEKF